MDEYRQTLVTTPPSPSEAAPVSSPVRLDELFARWIAYLDVRPKSVETYVCAVRQFLRWLHKHGKTANPAREDILAYRQFLAETKKPATVQTYIIALRLFFQWLAAEGVYNNIAEHIKGAKIERYHKKDYLTIEQVKNVLGRIEPRTERDRRDYASLLLMITGGLRDIEVSRANIGDIDAAGGNAVLYLRGKGQDERADYVKLTEPVITAINRYLQDRGETKPAAPLFISVSRSSRGSRLTTRSISRIAKQRLRDAGYDSDRLTAHSFRHSAITFALLGGLSLQETQQFARHTNISSTLIYAHNLERAGNRGAEVITGAIFA
jgi:integrase/recombinase XerC